MMRLRQIALVTPELRPVEQDICKILKLLDTAMQMILKTDLMFKAGGL